MIKSGKAYSRAKVGISHPTEIDSQERILRKESQERDLSQSSEQGKSGAAITRTDEVTVSFSNESKDGV